MCTRQTPTFVPFVLPVPVPKLLAFGSGDVDVVRAIHYRRDRALTETDISTQCENHVPSIYILPLLLPAGLKVTCGFQATFTLGIKNAAL